MYISFIKIKWCKNLLYIMDFKKFEPGKKINCLEILVFKFEIGLEYWYIIS